MITLKSIIDFFNPQQYNNDDMQLIIEKRKSEPDADLIDLGIFSYTDTGFNIEFDDAVKEVKWVEINEIQVYKADLITTDEICMDIIINDRVITLTESTKGWYRFIEIMKSKLKKVKNNWEAEVLKSPFEYNLTTIYKQ